MDLFKQNLTADERERLAYITGNLEVARLCDFESQTEDFCSIEPHLDEVRGSLMSEDFASEHVQDLRDFAQRLHGDNRAELLRLIGELQETINEQYLSADYGREELDKALKLVEV